MGSCGIGNVPEVEFCEDNHELPGSINYKEHIH